MSSYGRRSRLKLAVLLLFIVGAGLFTRSSRSSVLPVFIQQYAGDTLWALALYTFLAFVSPGAAAKELLLLSLFISFAVEFSQLYQADWLNTVRSVRVGGLILGYGFKWSDLLCYTTGALAGFAVDFRTRNQWR
jgi:glycopeptide antibiotics resistance protein